MNVGTHLAVNCLPARGLRKCLSTLKIIIKFVIIVTNQILIIDGKLTIPRQLSCQLTFLDIPCNLANETNGINKENLQVTETRDRRSQKILIAETYIQQGHARAIILIGSISRFTKSSNIWSKRQA